MNRLVREMERSARASQREAEMQHRAQLRAVREAERAQRAYERAAKADEKEQKRLYAESQVADAESRNEQIEDCVQSLGQILANGLSRNPTIDFSELYVTPIYDSLDLSDLAQIYAEPLWSEYEPEKPKGIASMFPWVKSAYEQRVQAAKRAFEQAHREFQAAEDHRQATIRQRHKEHERAVECAKRQADDHNQAIKQFLEAFSQCDPDAISSYFVTVLGSSPYCDGFPQKAQAEYQPESKQLIVAYDLPEYDALIPKLKSVKYVRTSDSFTESARPESQRRALYAEVIAQTALRSIHEIYASDSPGYVDTVVFNGYVHAIDRGTGKPVHPCIVTVRTNRDTFGDIDLAQVDPATCLKALNASVSKSAAELAPVRPVLELNMSDPRFIEEGDVLSTLDQRPNLMDLTPGEFESLITNLFQTMGLETRQTQASRDGGVDCVAFDPRPIFGGKVVIQAKRYKNTVGVSAVRDLFGTMQNEGASKGILVTTSGYGKAAFEFANGKPIELLAGSNLLYLLQEHANVEAKIVMPDDWKDIAVDQ
ncbi:restriction endonuclease [Burkholderia sp. Ac-20353]|uniref:restriction endonuclease n=1 Tax=Burkholderia sp. Ac-20353 TaxID=2703894 RepID=UPI00197C21AF|nr:restriction endonuclease [Burkholderia sp. Ac-20353]MBN3788302.1 restriction endonuclease [Burkholderia sp. Ac-20353]